MSALVGGISISIWFPFPVTCDFKHILVSSFARLDGDSLKQNKSGHLWILHCIDWLCKVINVFFYIASYPEQSASALCTIHRPSIQTELAQNLTHEMVIFLYFITVV